MMFAILFNLLFMFELKPQNKKKKNERKKEEIVKFKQLICKCNLVST